MLLLSRGENIELSLDSHSPAVELKHIARVTVAALAIFIIFSKKR